MDFRDMRVALDIFDKYTCGQSRDWGDEENRKKPIDGDIEFAYEKCLITIPRMPVEPEITQDERERLVRAGWFFDKDHGAWTHYG